MKSKIGKFWVINKTEDYLRGNAVLSNAEASTKVSDDSPLRKRARTGTQPVGPGATTVP